MPLFGRCCPSLWGGKRERKYFTRGNWSPRTPGYPRSRSSTQSTISGNKVGIKLPMSNAGTSLVNTFKHTTRRIAMTTDVQGMRGESSSNKRISSSTSITRHRSFVELPGEILSQIASSVHIHVIEVQADRISYLPFEELIPYLSLHPNLLTLTRSHLSPWPQAIRRSLLAGPPYPHLLGVLPSLRCFLPSDDGRLFVDLLVRARPRWILERLEMGHWKDLIWKEAFDKRFLPGWKAFKKEGDSWRAIFLRQVSLIYQFTLFD